MNRPLSPTESTFVLTEEARAEYLGTLMEGIALSVLAVADASMTRTWHAPIVFIDGKWFVADHERTEFFEDELIEHPATDKRRAQLLQLAMDGGDEIDRIFAGNCSVAG